MRDQSLRKVLSSWSGFRRIPRQLERPRRTQKAAAKATRILGDNLLRKPANYDLKNLYQRITQSWQRYCALPEYKRSTVKELDWGYFFEQEAAKSRFPASRDLRSLPWILFYSPHDNTSTRQQSAPYHWLGANAPFMKHYTQWLSERGSTRSIRMLIREFLLAYPIELSTFEELRMFLRNRIGDETVSNITSLRRWQQRCHQFDLLEAGGDSLFIEKIISLEDSVEEVFQQAGFDGRLAYGGFLETGIHAYLPKVHTLLRKDQLPSTRLNRLLQVVEYKDGLRFDDRSTRCAIAEGLLGPFTDEHLPDGARDLLEPFFMRHYGDPRLPSGKPKWSGVPAKFRQVVRGWLAEQALEAFFRVMEETALDYHWRYRQTFWTAYFNNNVIRDAWFVLGSSALRTMKILSDQEEYSYGLLRGAERTQSVLLIRIYGATIAEWSHNGACRIWLDGNQFALQLHKQKNPYLRSELMTGADFVQPHHGSESGRWQDQIATWLRSNTGIEVSREEYLGIRQRAKRIRPQQQSEALTKPWAQPDTSHPRLSVPTSDEDGELEARSDTAPNDKATWTETEIHTLLDSSPESPKAQQEYIPKTYEGLVPYTAFLGATGPHPRKASRAQVADGLCRIIRVEGPILVKRAYEIYLRDCGIHEMGRFMKKRMNQALYHYGIGRNVVVTENEWGKGGLVNLIIRSPRSPQVIPRQSGPRRFDEIPPSELQLVAHQLWRGQEDELEFASDKHLIDVLKEFKFQSESTPTRIKKLRDVLLRPTYPWVDEALRR